MNTQEIFETVANHLIKQGIPAKNGQFCRYKNVQGLKCAVGCLINDENYSAGLEGQALGDMRVLEAVQRSIGRRLQSEEIGMLANFQVIHDSQKGETPFDRNILIAGFKEIAEIYNLDMSFLN